ncbi:MAG: adenylate/guanylate cyclase domain-containing protein [Proteobacteria bacterium]|nr:adenylate/guanylate cyclase domain-containing protein [Pseudomonadota bacterium]
MTDSAPLPQSTNATTTIAEDVQDTFDRAEQTGLRLAIKGRVVALVLLGFWLGVSRSADINRVIEFATVLGIFAALGLAHFFIIGSKFDRRWIKFVFVTIDIAVLSALVATQPLFDTADLPPVMVYRSTIFPFYFVILGVAAFSFSHIVVVWTGIIGALGWLAAYGWKIIHMEKVLGWGDIPLHPTAEQVIAVALDPNFGGGGSRGQEAVAYLIVAILIAIVMWRARGTLQRQLEVERDNATITGIFGRFVPAAVADAMIADHGTLAPVERTATVLFADIEGFTALTETAGSAKVFDILNDYFDEVTRIIGAHKGVVTQFQGDAVLATFNVPLEDPAHADNAVAAARELLACVQSRPFAGAHLNIRVGVNTGPIVAGNVGGGGRQSYTVHGDAVNLAARLEAMNKETGTRLLVSESTRSAIEGMEFRAVGEVELRGLKAPVSVYTIT